jgi:hypothetical protein
VTDMFETPGNGEELLVHDPRESMPAMRALSWLNP